MRVTDSPIPLDTLDDHKLTAALDVLRIIKRCDGLFVHVLDPRAVAVMDLLRAGLCEYVFSDDRKMVGVWLHKVSKRGE